MNWNRIRSEIEEILGEKLRIDSFSNVHGGDINEAYRLQTNLGTFFLKYNSDKMAKSMFLEERKGLQELSRSNFIVPKALTTGSDFLLLEWIELTINEKFNWDLFGQNLAELHSISNDQFGWSSNNYIGTLSQRNTMHDDWDSFFVECRLAVQLKMARDSGIISKMDIGLFEKLYVQLHNLIPKEPPSLIHGDLWSGNASFTSEGQPCIYDPATHFGHRESDLAMTLLFGGFGSNMYNSYQEKFPLEKGFRDRVGIYNLYPLLVHLNLFGTSYLVSIQRILKQFV